MSRNPTIVLFNKPYGVQSQFRNASENEYASLADYFQDKSLRIAGRLDATSEGLLILTGCQKIDGQINKAITQPPQKNRRKQAKTYLVQVEGVVNELQIQQLSQGVVLKDGRTLPAIVKLLTEAELPIKLWQRNPPIRERKSIPTAWLMMTIFEGKNRQVRRMTAHVGLPCLRLIRWSVAGFEMGNLAVGSSARIDLNDTKLADLGIN